MKNYAKLNEYKYELQEKTSGRHSYFTTWCHGNIYEQIELYKNNLKKACLIGVSSETHDIVGCVHLFDNTRIF